jgi:SufBD protein N-terminal region
MNAEVRAIRTPAEQALNAAYAAARAKLPGKGAIAYLREAAFQRFDAAGLPHRRIEEWKYTDLRALMREAKPLAEPAKAKGKVPALPGLTAGRIVIVNGRYEQAWSEFKPVAGVELSDVFLRGRSKKLSSGRDSGSRRHRRVAQYGLYDRWCGAPRGKGRQCRKADRNCACFCRWDGGSNVPALGRCRGAGRPCDVH